jgi:hypothetical protein
VFPSLFFAGPEGGGVDMDPATGELIVEPVSTIHTRLDVCTVVWRFVLLSWIWCFGMSTLLLSGVLVVFCGWLWSCSLWIPGWLRFFLPWLSLCFPGADPLVGYAERPRPPKWLRMVRLGHRAPE